ncbi:Tetratricopeptide-like helical [Metarhizium album ARSEF 1941]|uniref:Tetratricopeptide-like helical n=1 Tax=Metarhizium album (strain ARSEF 1941) TaxID=1081103 RepID=A0A0B2WQ21_METAS|nr:Tetratricopeptide-like helical [Metarhizium album ARSEF 1941]KHN96118.1 Tetratricopeptide-like helical [Metarhizium album ARSEF 1941]
MNQPEKGPQRSHSKNKSFATAFLYQRTPRSRRASSFYIAYHPSSANPPSSSPLSSPSRPQPERLQAQLPQRTASQHRHSTDSPIPQVGESRPKDFSFLLRPEIYHPLTPLNVPVAFRNSPKQPDPATPLEQLLARGHFRAAAIASVQELTGSGARGAVDPTDSQRIFTLLYTRLVCLTLIDATPLAAQEVKALEDLSNVRTYVDDKTGEHLIPWELRVLNVRLQALGFGDLRRAIMSYYDLAREAREHIGRAIAKHDNSASELWKARLHELGVKVAGALIDMDDLSGAAHHLKSLRDKGDGKIALSKALLWLHLGDADEARGCAEQCSKTAVDTEKLILALCDLADGDYESALSRWQHLREDMPDDEMVGVNTAGRDILENLVESGFSSHTLLFNLSTMYELCTEKHRNLKTKLAERVAGMDESPAGWEKLNTDFKL